MKKDKTIIVGCSRFGSMVAAKLSSEGENVVVVDDKQNAFRKLGEEYSGYEVLGNGLDIDTLKEVGIEGCKRLIASTDDDNVNIYVAEVAAIIFQVDDVYVRLNDPNKRTILSYFNIKAIYPLALSMEEFDRIRKDG